MSSGNAFERLFKLWASVCKLVLDNKRSAEEVCDALQAIVTGDQAVKTSPSLSEMLSDWVAFYKEVFGLELDFSNLKIPAHSAGFDRLIVVAQGMTPQRLFDKCRELFPSWEYTEGKLDKVVQSDRTSKDGPYAIWVRNRQEADEENKNLSANQLKEKSHTGITLEERMLYELKYFKETNNHLDINNWTLCSGSRYSDGGVPYVGWSSGCRGVYVGWYDPDRRSGTLRSRSAVS